MSVLDDFSGAFTPSFPSSPRLYPETALSHRTTSRIQLRVGRETPAWLQSVLDRLNALSRLEAGWDGRGAQSLRQDDVVAALQFLFTVMIDGVQVPGITPLATGGLELHWVADNLDVEAVFDSARHEQVLLVEVGEAEWDAAIPAAGGLFASVVDRLMGERPTLT